MKDVSLMSALMLLGLFSFGQDDDVKGGRYKHMQYYFEKGQDALDGDRYHEAVESFDRCLKYDAYLLEPYFLRAMAKENLGDKDGALTDYNIILHMAPEHVEALFGRGLLYYHMEKYKYAEDDFEQLIKAPVKETAAVFFKFSNYESGVIGVMTMEAKEAEAYNYLGLIRSKLSKYELAIEDFSRAISLYPGDPNFFINRGLAYEGAGYGILAKEDFEKALFIDGTNSLATYNLLRLSDRSGAIGLHDNLIEANPLVAEPYAQRGLAKFSSGDYRGALKDYNEALSIDNSNHEMFVNRGLIREKLRDLSGAVVDYSEAATIKPDYAKAYLNRGNVLVKLRKYHEAITDYDLALLFGGNNPSVLYNRGVAHYNLQNYGAACEDVTNALELGLVSAGKAAKIMCD